MATRTLALDYIPTSLTCILQSSQAVENPLGLPRHRLGYQMPEYPRVLGTQ